MTVRVLWSWVFGGGGPGGCLHVDAVEHRVGAGLAAFGEAGLTSRLARDEELYAHVVIGVMG